MSFLFFIKGDRGDPETAASTKKSHSSVGNFPKAVWMESHMSDIPAPPETLAVRAQEGIMGVGESPYSSIRKCQYSDLLGVSLR